MDITIRPLTDPDLPTLARWLAKPHVAPWYTPAEDWLAEVRAREGEYAFIRHFIIEADGVPIGFCQHYPYWLGGEVWHGNLPLAGTYSIDYLVGEEAFLRKGCGAAAIRLLIRDAFARADAARIIVQPDEENLASQHVLRAAGFRLDAENGLFILTRAELGASIAQEMRGVL